MHSEKLKLFLKENNGYVTTNEMIGLGISKPMIKKYIEEGIIRKVEHGLYISNDLIEDELFILQKKNPSIVYSYNTAFFIMGLSEKIPSVYDVTVINGKKPRKRHLFKIHQAVYEKYNIGIETVLSNFSNPLKVYNIERCICDYLKNQNEIEIEVANKIIKRCFKEKKVNIDLLLEYALIFNVYNEVNTLIGGMID